jgi:hypothetical protein
MNTEQFVSIAQKAITECMQNACIATLKLLDTIFPGKHFHVTISITALDENRANPKGLLVMAVRTPRDDDEDTPTGPEEQALSVAALQASLVQLEKSGGHIANVRDAF